MTDVIDIKLDNDNEESDDTLVDVDNFVIESEPYKVYIKVDEFNRVIDINSSMFLSDTNDYICIDEGFDYPKYPHAQNNYLDKPLYTHDGIPQYIYIDGLISERTEEEINDDRASIVIPLSLDERVETAENDILDLDDYTMELLYQVCLLQLDVTDSEISELML